MVDDAMYAREVRCTENGLVVVDDRGVEVVVAWLRTPVVARAERVDEQGDRPLPSSMRVEAPPAYQYRLVGNQQLRAAGRLR